MFVINELAVKAENNYRRELLRDQYQNGRGTVGRVATLLVVASLVLAACGAAVPTGSASPGRAGDVVAQVSDPGPAWQPDESALSAALNGVEVLGISVQADNTGMWGEDAANLQAVFDQLANAAGYSDERIQLAEFLNGTHEATQHFTGFEPQGEPNYGRLDTYLNDESDDQSGPR